VVDAGHTVCGGRALIKDEFALSVAAAQRLPEGIMVIPHFQHLIVHLWEVKALVLGKFL